MKYLVDDKSRYAAAVLAKGFHGNVESALQEADRWEQGEFTTLVSNWPQYYLVYDDSWAKAYIVKRQDDIRRGPDVTRDDNVQRYRW